MRNWITIAESLSQEQISDAYKIIYEYVTYGEMTRPDQFDQKFQKLMQILPRPDHSMVLYRFLRLTPEQVQQIQNGGLVLEMRKFSSWTKSLEAAKRLSLIKRGNGEAVIVTARLPGREIVVNVAEFYEENEFWGNEFEEYRKYVKPEQEVIVNHSGSIRLTPENTTVESVPHFDPPEIGDDFFWDEDDEDSKEIIGVADEQPYAQRGIFIVDTEYDERVKVRNVGPGQWEAVQIEH